MTSTITIFDEFDIPVEHLSDSERHRKRVELEKLIFSTLKTTYGANLQAFWNQYQVPVGASKQIVLVERRIHENLEFLLHNCAWAGSEGGWSLAIVCSDMNLRYVEAILGSQKPHVQILPWFRGNPEPRKGKAEYNELLQTAEFYKLFQAETLCLVEMDCYFRKPIPEIVTDCDYLAAPYAWNPYEAGGGLSFRNRKAMIDICNQYSPKLENQDVFACRGALALGFTMPPLLFSKEMVAESILDADPVAVHQWWTFFDAQMDDAEEIFHRFMSISLNKI